MKVLGYLLLASVVLAALNAAMAALLVAAALAGVVSLIQRPQATLAALATVAATFAFVAHPLLVLGVLLASAGINRWRERIRPGRG